MQLTVARDMESLQQSLLALASAGKRVALVPTMGALHAGHRALVRHAGTLADAVVATVFVNPKQFGPHEDFDRYPRSLEEDIKKMDEAGATILYAPSMDDMYPGGFSTSVSAGELATVLDGRFRPGHFDGVATVVAKLLLRVLPQAAVFGEKDYQQLCVIRRIAGDLDIPVDIVGVPTVREADGLALSSRNAYLKESERKVAPRLFEVLNNVGAALVSQSAAARPILEQGAAALTRHGFKVDYLELRAADTLAPLDRFEAPARLLAAAWLGGTRLIDNIGLEK